MTDFGSEFGRYLSVLLESLGIIVAHGARSKAVGVRLFRVSEQPDRNIER